MTNRLILILLAVMLAMMALAGCNNNALETESTGQNSISAVDQTDGSNKSDEEKSTVDSQAEAMNSVDIETAQLDYPLVLTDMLGNQLRLAKKPNKIAVISADLIELFNSAGGTSICAVEPEDGSPNNSSAKGIPTVGKASDPDIVGILELEPDLVFAEAGLQNEVVSMLQKNKIAVIALKLDSKENREKALKLMKSAAGIN